MQKVALNQNFFFCPYSRMVMQEPVVLVPCGHCLDRESYRAHQEKKGAICFECKTEVSQVVPNILLKTMMNSMVVHALDEEQQQEDSDAEFYATGQTVKRQRLDATMTIRLSTKVTLSNPNRFVPSSGGSKLKQLKKQFLRERKRSRASLNDK